MKKITIGSRGSNLSKAYVSVVEELILKNSDDISKNDIERTIIKTSGDIFKGEKLSEIGGKNLFCKEIEENLIDNKIDIAVHSLKDMESDENPNLLIGAYLKRNDPRDVIISNKIKNFEELKNGAIVGSSSIRRELQLKKISKKIKIINIRGNVDTRIEKLEKNNFDAIILAAAGVKSLGLNNKISFILDSKEIIPSVGQGIIAVQCRKNDIFIKNILDKINDKESNLCATAERSMLKKIGGNCETAVGALAEINNKRLFLRAELFSDDGSEYFSFQKEGLYTEAKNIGNDVGEKLLQLAGSKFKNK